MIRNSFKIFIRSFIREKTHALINTFGLALGISAFLLISLYLKSELAYDKFHDNSERIHRVLYQSVTPTNSLTWSRTGPAIGPAVEQSFSEVESVTRILAGKNVLDPDPLVSYGDKQFLESRLFFADSEFFEVFTFETLDGGTIEFSDPYDLVLTESSAKKYFGNKNPIGEVLQISGQGNYTIRQVIEDVPANSHFHFDLVANFQSHSVSKDPNWTWTRVYTYLLLRPDTDPRLVENHLQDEMDKFQTGRSFSGASYDDWKAAGNSSTLLLQPLESIHLESSFASEFEPGGDIVYIRLFLIVALLVLLLAIINFVNLSTAKATRRAKEIGVRKALGARRKQLIGQFIFESVLTCLIASLVAIFVTILVFPYLNAMFNDSIAIPTLRPWMSIVCILFVLLLGIISGAYPAFYLSRFQPIKVLKVGGESGRKTSVLRNALIVTQFCASIGLIIATATIYNQVNFMKNKDRGFASQLMILDRANVLDMKTEAFKDALKSNPLIENVSGSSTVPGNWIGSVSLYPKSGTVADRLVLQPIFTDFDFGETYGLTFLYGRGFSEERASDSLAVIINEAAMNAYGFTSIDGKYLNGWGGRVHPIVGVVKDFNQKSAKEKVEPMIIFANFFSSMQNMTIRLAGDDLEASIASVRNTWNKFAPSEPMMYSFLDDKFNKLYRSEQEVGNLFLALCTLAMVIAGLGLYGLVTFSSEQRAKEFAIRKVLGATSAIIFWIMGKDFGRLVLLSITLALPMVYFLMDAWLDNFAYRSGVLPLWTIALALFAALGIVVIAVLGKTIKSATESPIYGLRQE